MTAPSPAGGGSGGAWKWLLPIVAAVVLTVLVVPSGDDGPRYDLNSAEPGGYRGLRLLLEGGKVEVSRLDADAVDRSAATTYDVVFVPDGGAASSTQVARWRRYVAAGGRLVLGSPSRFLGAPPVDPDDSGIGSSLVFSDSVDPGDCAIDALSDAGSIVVPAAQPIDVSGGEYACYSDGEQALVAADDVGRGEVITIASPDLFANEPMGAPLPDKKVGRIPGNAVVAERLLAHGPTDDDAPPGDTTRVRLGIVTSGIDIAADAGDRTLADLISPGVKLGLLELGVAFLIYVLARGRRHGRVVTEPVPVNIAGSAFVEAVGSLLERQGDVARAAAAVRRARSRELARRLGRPLDIGTAELAVVLAERTGRDARRINELLTDPVDQESDLVSLTRELDTLCQEALHV